MTSGETESTTPRRTPLVRDAFYPDEFDYALAPATESTPAAGARIRESLFAIQDDLTALPTDSAPMHVLHREIAPWRRFDYPMVDAAAELEFTLGFGPPGEERFMALTGAPAPVATLDEARQDLVAALRATPDQSTWVTIICRPRPRWKPPAGATSAVTAVREHMRAASVGDVVTLRRGATGPLLEAMGSHTDARLTDAVRDAYDTAPTVLVLARNNSRPGHHHVLTNSTLHFDVDDSTGRWLIRQVRRMRRTDQFGTLLACWQPLLVPDADVSDPAHCSI